MKLLLIFIYLITSNISYALEKPNIKNLVLSKNTKIYEEVVFKDTNNYDVNLDDFKGKLLILNFLYSTISLLVNSTNFSYAQPLNGTF